MTLLYRILPDAEPPAPDLVAVGAAGEDECDAYGEEPEQGSQESRSGDVVCSLVREHPSPHWDGWDRCSWVSVP